MVTQETIEAILLDCADALERIGCTAEDVAEHLRVLRIKGIRQLAWRCPLANYLRCVVPSAAALGDNLYVGPDSIAVVVVVREHPTDPVLIKHRVPFSRVANGDAVKEFIRRFDAGEYEYLEE